MNYSNGIPVRLGDHVAIELGRTPGCVTDVVEGNGDLRQWNVDEPGLMIESAPFGLVFWPISSPDPVIFVQRANLQPL